MGMRSSWGLILDLGEDLDQSEHKMEHTLFHQFWDVYGPPVFKMGTYHGLPQAAEGKVTIDELKGKAYTKFEKDTIGYPPGWEVPTLFALSLFKFENNLPDNQILIDYLLSYLQQCQSKLIPFRMAAIGNMGGYYFNAEMINAEWVTLQQQDVHTLILTNTHPLTRQLEGITFGEHHTLLRQESLKTLWRSDNFEARHKRYKQAISKQMHTELLSLEWETRGSN